MIEQYWNLQIDNLDGIGIHKLHSVMLRERDVCISPVFPFSVLPNCVMPYMFEKHLDVAYDLNLLDSIISLVKEYIWLMCIQSFSD